MSIDYPLEFAVERVRPGGVPATDIFGDPVHDGADVVDVVEVFGWSQPTTEELDTAGTIDRIKWDVTLYSPAGEITHQDRVRLDGVLYEVVGIANFDHNPWWAPALDAVKLQRVEG